MEVKKYIVSLHRRYKNNFLIFLDMDKNNKTTQLVMFLSLIISGSLSLTDEQVDEIIRIILRSSTSPVNIMPPPERDISCVGGDTVRGMAELAQILGVSVPTACKISRSGVFEEARLNFGTKKFIWDKRKLLEIARRNKKEK